MKLIMAIVSNDDTNFVIKALYKEKFQATKLATTGGCEDDDVQKVIDIIGTESKKRTEIVPSTASYEGAEIISTPIQITVGGATIFVLNVEQFVKL